MKSLKNIKKSLLSILMVAILVPTLIFTTTGVKANADEIKPVQLYCSDTYYGYIGSGTTSIYIKVANLDSNKKVNVHYQSFNNQWLEESAKYLTTLSDGSEIWIAQVCKTGSAVSNFFINTVQNGQAYCDDNNGNNYSAESAGIAPVKAVRSIDNYSIYSGKVKIAARVQNYSFNKKVTVRYTTNNWTTYQDAELSFDNSKVYNDGTELWSTELSLPVTGEYSANLQYAIKYEVNGQTYWDNNFGRNYNDSDYRTIYR